VQLAANSAGSVAAVQERIVIKNGSLTLVVEDAEGTITRISKMAGEMGGWVVSSNTSNVSTTTGEEVKQGTITIRVPAEQLDSALAHIKSGVVSVEQENISGQDVTQEYIDLNSRLTNLEAAEIQLRAILEDARKTEDVMLVYNQLVQVRGEIETIRGQIRFYQESAAYSSITVDIVPKAIEAPIQIAGWSPGRTVERAIAALLSALQFLADVVIMVVIVGFPLLLLVAIPAWLIRRALNRRGIRLVPAPSGPRTAATGSSDSENTVS
jgi:hypothetical protein